MKPLRVIRFGSTSFDSETVCLGSQLSEILRIIDRVTVGLDWYVADVQTLESQFPQYARPAPVKVGDTITLRKLVETVSQFEGGVFAGVPADIAEPAFRDGGLWTEDEEFADIGDAIVEVRAFDTSYISVASRNLDLLEAMEREIVE